MSAAAVRGVVRQLGPSADPVPDADLLTAFAAKKDTDAFAAIVARHGPSVFGVCRRVLGDSHDAEDAFQAVFLVLAQKASSVRPPGSVGGWLYGVAVRTANKAKVAAARRRRREMIVAAQAVRVCEPPNSAEHIELCSVLDRELAKLPEPLRAAIVLCDLHGKTRAEVAAELRCPEGTIAARLHRARKKLADALSRCGLAIPAAGLATVLTPAVVSANTMQSALSVALGTSASPAVLALAREVIRSMATTTKTLTLAILTLVAGGLLAVAGTQGSSEPLSTTATLPTPVAEAIPEPPAGEKPTLPSGYVSDLRFSPDGKQYLIVAGGTLAIHDTATRKVMWTAAGEAASFLPDGKAIIVMGEKKVTLHDKDTGKTSKEFSRPNTNWAWHFVAFSPDGKRYAAHFGFDVRIYDSETGFEPIRLEHQYELGSSALMGMTGRALSFSPDSKKVFAVGVLVAESHMGAAGWDLETGKQISSQPATDKDGPRSAAYSVDGKSLAIGYQDRVDVWINQKAPPKALPIVGTATVTTFSPDGKLLAVGLRKQILNGADKEPFVLGRKSEVQLLDVATGKEVRRFDGFERDEATTELAVSALTFSPDGKTLLAGTGILPMEQFPNNKGPKAKTGEVKMWSLDGTAPAPANPVQWREKVVLKDTEDLIASVAFAADGKTFAAGGVRGNVSVWNAADHKHLLLHNPDSNRFHTSAVAYSLDGKLLAVAEPNGIQLLDTATWKIVRKFEDENTKRNDAPSLAIAFGQPEEIQGKKLNRLALTDGHSVATTTWIEDGPPGTAKFGPLAGVAKIEGSPAGVAYSPDGKQLVFIPYDKMPPDGPDGKPDPKKEPTHWIAMVWGGGSGARIRFLKHGTAPVTAVAWSPDGKYIATGGADGAVVLWDGKTFKEVRRIDVIGRSPKGTIHAIAFTHDGQTLAAAAEFDEGRNVNRVMFFDAATGGRGPVLQNFPNSTPLAVAFSPDGKTLIVGCGYRNAKERKLTPEEWKTRGEVRVFTTEPETPKPAAPPPGNVPLAANPTGRQWDRKKTIQNLMSSVVYAPDGKSFTGAQIDGTVVCWKAGTFDKLWETKLEHTFRPALTYQSADRQIFVTTVKGVAMLDAQTGKSNGVWDKVLDGSAIAWSQIADRLAVSNGRKTLVLNPQQVPGSLVVPPQDIVTLDEPSRKIGGKPTLDVAGVAWSPDGKRLALLRHEEIDGKWGAVVWGGRSGDVIKRLAGHTKPVFAVAWSNSIVLNKEEDGKPQVVKEGVIASGDKDGQVILWDGASLKELHRIKIQGRNGSSDIRALAFSPDGRALAAAVQLDDGKGVDRVVLIDTITGKEIDFLQVNSSLASVAWSPDGNTLITACGLLRWDLQEPFQNDKERGEVVIWERVRN